MRLLSGLFIIMLATTAGTYLMFRPVDVRKKDRKRITQRVKNTWNAVTDYMSRLFHTEKDETSVKRASPAAA